MRNMLKIFDDFKYYSKNHWFVFDFHANLLILILFFLTKKVCKKVKAVEKSYDFAFDFRQRQKNSLPKLRDSNSFWLHPAPVEQNRDFSKAGNRSEPDDRKNGGY
jgi:hypothetical protein